jgi:hypothetical protein
MIAMFDGACPSGWTEVTAFRNRFVRGHDGDSSYGETGGSDTHDHSYSGTTGGPSDEECHKYSLICELSSNTHTHDYSGTTDTSSNIPAFREVVFCKKN